MLQVVLSSSLNLNKAYFYKFLHPWLGTGLVTATGTQKFPLVSILNNFENVHKTCYDHRDTIHHPTYTSLKFLSSLISTWRPYGIPMWEQ